MNVHEAADKLRRHAWFGYILAAATFAGALGTRFAFDRQLSPGYPFVTFFPAVIVTTFFGGVRSGIWCAIACGLAAWYWFIVPTGTFKLDASTTIALGFYSIVVIIDIVIIHAMNLAMEKLQREQRLTSRLYAQQSSLFQELQHRVANNMQFATALLSMQKRRVEQNPEQAVAALSEARIRLETMARVHRRLYDPENIDIPLGAFFQELCTDMLSATGAKNIVCMVNVPAVRFDLRTMMTLSLIVVEAITNSIKHAFPEGEGGTISVNLEPLEDHRFALTVGDSGKGLPAGIDPSTTTSLGLRILQGFAQSLRGELSFPPGQGASTRIVFPDTGTLHV